MSADYRLKFVLIGSSDVGKTTVVHQFLGKEVNDLPTTVGVLNYEGIIRFQGSNKIAKIDINDTAGEERFRSITSSYFRGAHGILLVYDVTCPKSFTDLDHWKEFYEQYCPDNIIVMLIGNKCDCITSRKVTLDEGLTYANNNGRMLFMETSAKTNHNIQEVFEAVAEGACRLIDDSQFMNTLDVESSLRNDNYIDNIKLHEDNNQQQSDRKRTFGRNCGAKC